MSSARGLAPDQSTRDRITGDLGTNFIVEAGAGSGKTYSLAERMAAGIARGTYSVEHMAAVTFTRKAAAELRGRFQQALEGRLRAGGDAAQEQRLRDALADIERFFAGTIHAFCARLLRERPVEANIAPGFVEIDEAEDLVRRDLAWRDYLARESARDSVSLRQLRATGIRPSDLVDAFGHLCDHADVGFPAGEATQPDAGPVWMALEAFSAALEKDLPDSIPSNSTCEVQGEALALPGRLRVARRNRPADLVRAIEPWQSLKPTKKYWGNGDSRGNPVADRVAALVKAFQDETVKPFLAHWRAWSYRIAVPILDEARAFYAEERRRQNVVNYVDLLMMAARLLRENPDVRGALQRKYRWLFIDEFQDTDPIQAEVFVLLAADDKASAGPLDWTRVRFRPGALFVVGDPKQSIYRFRRADIDIYNRVRAQIVACGGDVLALTANFRSVPQICAFANEVFKAVFPPQATVHAAAFEPLQPVRGSSDRDGAAIVTLTIDGVEAKEVPAVEAARIASWMRAEVDAGRRRYGDVLVLTRNRPRLRVYAAAFEALEIPVEVSGAGMFGDSDEVDTLRALLEALADPLDGVALVGVLRGPLFGLRDADLFRYRAAGGVFDLGAPVPVATDAAESAELDERFGPALPAMHLLRRLSSRVFKLPLAAAVDAILEDTGLLALAAATPGGAKAGDLLQALDRVRQVAETGGGLSEAAAALAADAPETNDVESLPLEPGRRNVVRLMNLHKAKGLEANVVFLADPTNGFSFDADVRIVRESVGATGWLHIVRQTDSHRSVQLASPLDWDAHADAERPYRAAELDRLLYVAATRACDLLVIGRSSNPKHNKAWSALTRAASAMPELTVSTGAPAMAAPVEGVTETRESDADARLRRLAAVAVPSWRVERVTDETRTLARATRIRRSVGAEVAMGDAGLEATAPGGVAWTASEQPVGDPTEALVGASPSHRADAGAVWGSLIHGLLEHAMRRPDCTALDLERLARWLLVEHADVRPFIGEAIACVQAVRRAPFWQAAQRAGGCHVEVPFAIRQNTHAAHSVASSAPPGSAPTRPAPAIHGGAGQRSLFDLLEPSTAPPAARRLEHAPEPLGVTDVPVLLRGVIDLVYRADDGWRIVDYKTDLLVADVRELVARYGDQVRRYQLAWEATVGEPVSALELFHVRSGEAAAVGPDIGR